MKSVYSSYRVRLEQNVLAEEKVVFSGPEVIREAWKKYVTPAEWFTESQEMVVVFHLNTKGVVTGHHLVSIGTMDSCMAHPRDIFRAAILNNSRSIIMVHNHPSGALEPSDSDCKGARQLAQAGKTLGIDFLDSIIVDNEGENYLSLKESSYLW